MLHYYPVYCCLGARVIRTWNYLNIHRYNINAHCMHTTMDAFTHTYGRMHLRCGTVCKFFVQRELYLYLCFEDIVSLLLSPLLPQSILCVYRGPCFSLYMNLPSLPYTKYWVALYIHSGPLFKIVLPRLRRPHLLHSPSHSFELVSKNIVCGVCQLGWV